MRNEGPDLAQSYDIYELPFSKENVKSLFAKVEDNNCSFNVLELVTKDAKDVRNREHRIEPASIKERLDLFMNQSFDILIRGTYLPAPVLMEKRMEAVAKHQIGGVASDYQMQSSTTSAPKGAYT
jgi:hypothetical protein